jgi:hypothetical protein
MLNENQISDLWALFTGYIDKKQLDVAAERYIEFLVDSGVADGALKDALGADKYLDHAIKLIQDDESDDEYDD